MCVVGFCVPSPQGWPGAESRSKLFSSVSDSAHVFHPAQPPWPFTQCPDCNVQCSILGSSQLCYNRYSRRYMQKTKTGHSFRFEAPRACVLHFGPFYVFSECGFELETLLDLGSRRFG